MAKKPTDDLFEKSTMTFGEHLEELRVCLFRGVAGVVLGVVVGFFVANDVVRFFQSPLEHAMERYYVNKALDDFKDRFGRVEIEVHRQIVDEGLIPESLSFDSGEIATALNVTYPRQFADLSISPHWFTMGDFWQEGAWRVEDSARQLAIDLKAAKDDSNTPPGRIWQLLGKEQRRTVERLASAGELPLAADTKAMLEVLNEVAGQRELHESPEFADIRGPDVDFAITWTNKVLAFFGRQAPPASDTVTAIREQLAERFDAEQSRRLNKLLIARVFPKSLRKARLNLMSLLVWRPVKVRFQVLNAQEAFMIWLKAALTTGLVLASPYIFFQIWTFVAAGLYPHEKHYVYLYLPISIALFLGGAALAFVFVFQPVLDFLFTFNRGMNADFDPRVGEWLSFVLILPLGFGISFQLPLVMLFLNRIGIASLDFYIQQWRIAILTICVISMVLTPADPVSMLLMAAPLCLLYVLGILMCKYMPAGRSPFAEAYEP
jgi:sec-independent protein translocase protein TatC